MMIMTKLRFIDLLKDERERDKDTVKITVRDQHKASHMSVM